MTSPTAPGVTRWVIAEGYVPSRRRAPEPQMTSHETACILNAGDTDAHVQLTIYFSDRETAGPYRLTVGARRTLGCTSGSTSWTIPNRSPETPTSPASSSRTSRSSCSTPGWTAGRQSSVCSARSRTRARDGSRTTTATTADVPYRFNSWVYCHVPNSSFSAYGASRPITNAAAVWP